MSQIPADRNDPRSRYTHQAYDVSYLGKSKETGPSGVNKRLSATYQANILMQAAADDSTAQLMGDLTQGVFITGVINHAPLTSGTAVLTLPAFGGEPEVVVTTQAIDLTTGSVVFTGINEAVYLPLSIDRPLTVTVTGGTASETAVLSLLVTAAETGWK